MKYTKLTPRPDDLALLDVWMRHLDRRGGTEEERKAIRHLCRGGGIKKSTTLIIFLICNTSFLQLR